MIQSAALWILYFTIHSVLASVSVKAWFQRTLPVFFKYYRMGYNLLAVGYFITLFSYQRSIEPVLIGVFPSFTKWLAYGMIASGVLIIAITFKNYSLREFTGIHPAHTPPDKLNSKGLNSIVRHPIYMGTILMLTGYLLLSFTWQSLIFVFISAIYLFIGIALEERKLVQIFGQEYTDYRKKVPAIIPKLPIKR